MRDDLLGPAGPRDFMTIWMESNYIKGQLFIELALAAGISKIELAEMAADDCARLEFKLNLLREQQNGKS